METRRPIGRRRVSGGALSSAENLSKRVAGGRRAFIVPSAQCADAAAAAAVASPLLLVWRRHGLTKPTEAKRAPGRISATGAAAAATGGPPN